MIIFWNGNGILALPVLLGSIVLPLIGAVFLVQSYPNSVPEIAIQLSLVLGMSGGGIVCWKLGRAWNLRVKDHEYHTLYFVRVEYWGILWILLSAFAGLWNIFVVLANAFL